MRSAPRATEDELEHGIPAFLDQLAAILRSKLLSGSDVGYTVLPATTLSLTLPELDHLVNGKQRAPGERCESRRVRPHTAF